MTNLPYYLNVAASVSIVFISFLFAYYYRSVKRLGLIPVTDDLTFILVHLRCAVTGNPPLTQMFKLVSSAKFYSKYYRNLFAKLYGLIRNWGYSAPDALRLVSRETRSKVDEMLLQRLSAIVATGADLKEYLRIEYNTLFSEYVSAYNRLIGTLRVILGVYVTLLGALVFMVANLMLLGLIFGGIRELMITAMSAMAFTLTAMAVLLWVFSKKPLFEAKVKRKPLILRIVSIGGLASTTVFAGIMLYLSLTLKIMDLMEVSKCLIISGIAFLPVAVLVKIHEGRINEYDMFYPAFIRSYGEHMSVVPNFIESLKPLLVAELGKLKGLIQRVFARLVNRIEPRIAWNHFTEESASEFITRATTIFLDTVEVGGNTAEAGALLSDHLNELYRIRVNYIQVFKTFEATLYIMHIATIIILMLITGFITLFSDVISAFAGSVPPEFADILAFFNISKEDVSLLTNILLIVVVFANALTLYTTSVGSRYSLYYFLAILLILTGAGMYVSTYMINYFINTLLAPGLVGG
ncbi:MAG: type II secretion system F family protein [Thermoprotei archaeon]